jgi:tetratricopeptide (TPR) repeat protein
VKRTLVKKFKENVRSGHCQKRGILLTFFVALTIFTPALTHAQSADSVYNQYLDFNLARFQGEQDKIMDLGEKLIPVADKLPEKSRINFYFSVGKMYEDDDQAGKALPFYEKVAEAVPNYYVVHRALGYIYYDKAKAIDDKISAAGNNKTAADSLASAWRLMARKALPHLEKAQACDPSDDTLDIIKTLYQKLNDPQSLSTINDRLKQFHANCIDILNDN